MPQTPVAAMDSQGRRSGNMFWQALALTVAVLTLSRGGSISATAESLGGEDAVAIIGQKLTGENLGELHDFSLRMSRNSDIPYTAALRGLLAGC
jgi:hypothetical protein